MTLSEWQFLAAKTLAQTRPAVRSSSKRTPPVYAGFEDAEYKGMSWQQIIAHEKAKIERLHRARERILDQQVKNAKRGIGSVSEKEIVEQYLDRINKEVQQRNPYNRDPYEERHYPKKR
jgi:hypothetical protein